VSQDFQLGHRCPHLIMEESVSLETDRRSLTLRAPVASTTILRVMANDTTVPPSGLHSQATLIGAVSGPFLIEGCATGTDLTDANILTVTSSTETHTFRLPLGQRITADALVRVFREDFDQIYVSNENGHLAFIDVGNIGASSKIYLTGRGAEAIGFTNQKAAQGRQVYPAWGLDKRPDTVPFVGRGGVVTTTARYVKFAQVVRGNPTWKVTYVAPPERCPRCRGTFIENDWRFNVEGDPLLIGNENLLYQAALKILLTVRGSNPYHTAYGSTVLERVGKKALGATAAQIQEDVRSALGRMQTLQKGQAKYQQVTLKERLHTIMSVEVMRHRQDPTVFMVDVVVSNGTGSPINLSVVFSVPGAVALAGTNNLSLGLDATGLTTAESRQAFNG
jgi:phage baseplate assembly protein W